MYIFSHSFLLRELSINNKTRTLFNEKEKSLSPSAFYTEWLHSKLDETVKLEISQATLLSPRARTSIVASKKGSTFIIKGFFPKKKYYDGLIFLSGNKYALAQVCQKNIFRQLKLFYIFWSSLEMSLTDKDL